MEKQTRFAGPLQVILKEREEKKRIRLLDETTYLSTGDMVEDDAAAESGDNQGDVEESPDLSQDGQCRLL